MEYGELGADEDFMEFLRFQESSENENVNENVVPNPASDGSHVASNTAKSIINEYVKLLWLRFKIRAIIRMRSNEEAIEAIVRDMKVPESMLLRWNTVQESILNETQMIINSHYAKRLWLSENRSTSLLTSNMPEDDAHRIAIELLSNDALLSNHAKSGIDKRSPRLLQRTTEKKSQAIERVRNGGSKIAVARVIGISKSTLSDWSKSEQSIRSQAFQLPVNLKQADQLPANNNNSSSSSADARDAQSARSASIAGSGTVGGSSRLLTVEEKLQAIERVRNGESKAVVARSIDVAESTFRGWCKSEEKIRRQAQLSANLEQANQLPANNNNSSSPSADNMPVDNARDAQAASSASIAASGTDGASSRLLTAEDKLQAIERVRNGEPKAVVARSIGVAESTFRGWCKRMEVKMRSETRNPGYFVEPVTPSDRNVAPLPPAPVQASGNKENIAQHVRDASNEESDAAVPRKRARMEDGVTSIAITNTASFAVPPNDDGINSIIDVEINPAQ